MGHKPNHEAGIGFIDYGSSDDEFDEEAGAVDTPGPAATPMAGPLKRKSTKIRRTTTVKGPREWQKLERGQTKSFKLKPIGDASLDGGYRLDMEDFVVPRKGSVVSYKGD